MSGRASEHVWSPHVISLCRAWRAGSFSQGKAERSWRIWAIGSGPKGSCCSGIGWSCDELKRFQCHTLNLYGCAFWLWVSLSSFIVSCMYPSYCFTFLTHFMPSGVLDVMQRTASGDGLDCLGLSWRWMSLLVSKRCIEGGEESIKFQDCAEYPTAYNVLKQCPESSIFSII